MGSYHAYSQIPLGLGILGVEGGMRAWQGIEEIGIQRLSCGEKLVVHNAPSLGDFHLWSYTMLRPVSSCHRTRKTGGK